MTPNGVKQRLSKKLFNDADDANRRHKKKGGSLSRTEENKIKTEIKIEKNVVDSFEFEGTVFEENNTAELINRMNLDKTSRSNLRKKEFICFICNKSFNYKSPLKKHILLHSRKELYNSTVYNKKHNKYLKPNLKMHISDKPIKCNICDRTFSSRFYLISHTMTHAGEKPFICGICGQAFPQSRSLKRHSRIHTGDKPFKCDICGHAFFQSSDLSIHTRTHTGEKPFKCDICDRAFSQSQSLKRHTRTHTGEKPFICDICGRAYSQSTHLKNHTRKYHGEKAK
ncbi:zinc finger protein 525-like [Acyrthosiphon pisum]|uniref:C2H2-type domain-containing protein n=1 Tax=Acyrthosiphon pisum TaxID=7029 RepID=A0A8R2H6R7_ACYPI|nr:zinc finger protein 525-like [Acyrthosiphon pisum]|eukprot:XP_016656480.1 PREDICTED: zinc finger protein 525-like [Acyrthosiphon pisum]